MQTCCCHGRCFGYSVSMNIPAGLLPGSYLLWSALAVSGLLALALLSAPWSKLRGGGALHVYLGAIVLVSVIWSLRGGIQSGLGYHLLGVSALCLMFEWQFALFAVCAVLVLNSAFGTAGWETFGFNLLVMGVVPVVLTRTLLYLCQRLLPHNFFIYVFVNAFLAGALSMLASGLVSAGLQQLSGVHAPGSVYANFVMVLPMLMFGEGFLNGAALSLAVAYRPQWVATFHDRWYLQGK